MILCYNGNLILRYKMQEKEDLNSLYLLYLYLKNQFDVEYNVEQVEWDSHGSVDLIYNKDNDLFRIRK